MVIITIVFSHSRFKVRVSGFDRITESSNLIFLKKLKQCRFSKKQKVNGLQLSFLLGFTGLTGLSGQSGHTKFFLFIFFFNSVQFQL